MFQGQQLFVCEEHCGLFVSLDKLAPTHDIRVTNSQASKVATPKKGFNLFGVWKDDAQVSSGIFPGPVTLSQSQQKKDVPHYKNGDRVVCHNKRQILVHGTVRWTGETRTDSGKIKAVGIETVNYLYNMW